MEDKQTRSTVVCAIARYWALFVGTVFGAYIAYVGSKAIVTRSLVSRIGLGQSGPWFPKPLQGTPAVLAGLSLIAIAAAIISLCAAYGPARLRLPAWARFTPWLFFVTWLV